MKIAIVGIGSVGSVYGSLLSKTGSDVLLFTRREEHARAILENGITITNSAGKITYFPQATCDFKKLADRDLVIVLVKTYDLNDVSSLINKYASPKSMILSLQNGLGIVETISGWIDYSRIIAGATYIGAKKLNDHLIILGNNLKTVIGEPSGRITTRVNQISNLFQDAGFSVEISNHVLQSIWEKVLITASQNALGALTGLTVGQMMDFAYSRYIIKNLFDETCLVAHAKGVDLQKITFNSLIENAILLKDHHGSMWQDLQAQRKTEIESINGMVVKFGKQYQIPTPYNEMITNLIHTIEESNKSKNTELFSEKF